MIRTAFPYCKHGDDLPQALAGLKKAGGVTWSDGFTRCSDLRGPLLLQSVEMRGLGGRAVGDSTPMAQPSPTANMMKTSQAWMA